MDLSGIPTFWAQVTGAQRAFMRVFNYDNISQDVTQWTSRFLKNHMKRYGVNDPEQLRQAMAARLIDKANEQWKKDHGITLPYISALQILLNSNSPGEPLEDTLTRLEAGHVLTEEAVTADIPIFTAREQTVIRTLRTYLGLFNVAVPDEMNFEINGYRHPESR